MGKDPKSSSKQVISQKDYAGRGQTYVKHIFLQNYLYELAFKVLQAPGIQQDFVYIDGFSGPWRTTTGSANTDTSFHIALRVLSDVKTKLAEKGRTPRFRAIFVERDPNSVGSLRNAVAQFTDIETAVISGEFEDTIPDIVNLVDAQRDFLFSFIDPTGWKGLALDRLAPLLKLRGEALVNFMTNSVVRHLELKTVRGTFDQFFGGRGWKTDYLKLRQLGHTREDAVQAVYMTRLQKICGFRYTGTTRVCFTDKQRTYFHLAYGTRHPAGMEVFRRIEANSVEIQERLGYQSRMDKRSARLAADDLFSGVEDENLGLFREWRQLSRSQAQAEFEDWLNHGRPERRRHLCALLMQHPYVDLPTTSKWLRDAEAAARLVSDGHKVNPLLTPSSWTNRLS
jgi:three-Cys-motif partner protein